MRAQVYSCIGQVQLLADIMPVKQNRIFGNQQQVGDFLIGFAFLDQVGDADFHGGEIDIARREAADER